MLTTSFHRNVLHFMFTRFQNMVFWFWALGFDDYFWDMELSLNRNLFFHAHEIQTHDKYGRVYILLGVVCECAYMCICIHTYIHTCTD